MPSAPPATGTARSADGTAIGYRQLGDGPGLILVHGGLQASQNLLSLASALSGRFTVYIPDWRGRGISQKLLEAAERFAGESGYQWIYLDTTDGMAAAVRLYERNGYRRCGRYNQNPQATIFMCKQLLPGV